MTRIEFLRRELGWKQKELADQYNGHSCDISQIELGVRKPWPRVRKSIAQALGVSEADLFDDNGWPLEVDWELPSRVG